MTEPRIVATRDGYRLVHRVRDPESWPNVSDLTLERQGVDAIGHERWVYVDSWCLSAHTQPLRDNDSEYIALKMLLDPGPVIKEEK